jgi:signal transduction histidine kinase/CheY-like chemotaxis protein
MAKRPDPKASVGAIRDGEAQYRSLFENMLNGLAYCRMIFEDNRPMDFVYLAVNKAFEAQTGLKDVAGRKVSEVIPAIRESDPELFEVYGRVARTGKPEKLETYVAALRQWFALSVYSPSRDHFVVVFDVITARKKAEEERERLLRSERKARADAETASRAKDEFLALVSHELRTPITAILGWSWLLRSGDLSPSERKNALEVIERNMQIEKQIIDDILDASSLERHQLSLKKQVLDLGNLVTDTAAGFRTEFRAKSVRLACETTADLLVEGDPRRLRQVFWNLLSNATKFTPKGGTVTVLACREESNALVSVEDTGPGISPEFYSKLFGLFGQQEPALTRAHGGLGLGLAIVKHLVGLHRGTVSVAPPVRGQGAKITVTLPLVAASQAGPPPEPSMIAAEFPPRFSESLRGVCLLVVDDDDGTREMLLSVLTHFGAQAQGAASAAEGFTAFTRDRPDVLISDIAMPEEDGYGLIRRIRALRPEEGGEVPAAALTAYGTAEDRAQALRAGFQMYIPKPVDPPELLAVVRALARRTGLKPT